MTYLNQYRTRRLALIITTLFAAMSGLAATKNGFDLADSLVPENKIFQGGPPRDGIASIDKPVFVTADKSDIGPEHRVLGLNLDGQARAYPIAILNRHEVVNDRFNDTRVVVSYCPLCGSGMVFIAPQLKQGTTFGVSGLLYNSDVLLYDRETESLWSQLQMQAISGPLKGQRLDLLPASHTTWEDWMTRYPESLVLSSDTGFGFDYSHDPYADYQQSDTVWFPVAHQNADYRNKEWVAGVVLNGLSKAYPFSELEHSSGDFKDRIGTTEVQVTWSQVARSVKIKDAEGNEIPSVTAYWFAWYGFYPDTAIYRACQSNSATGTINKKKAAR